MKEIIGEGKRIVWLSDFDMKASGYFNISVPLCNELQLRGHSVKAIGLNYKGEPHPWKFSLIPCEGFSQVPTMIQNLHDQWRFDVLVVAMDIPVHERLIRSMKNKPFKYVGIMPVEADPLMMSWAMVLMQMDKCFIISEFGTNEAQKLGVPAEHIQVGVDCESWKLATEEDKKHGRSMYGFDEDDFIVLTVADNQERKNLSTSIEVFSEFAKDKDNVKYVMVTRKNNVVGWRLQDYATKLGIANKFVLLERGLPHDQLWMLYAASDVHLLLSKAEGLGMPLLEAMAVGVTNVGTNCTAIEELLADNRGILVDWYKFHNDYYTYTDPFGNAHRYFAKHEDGIRALQNIYDGKWKVDIEGARKFVEARDWGVPVNQIDGFLRSI